MSTATDETRGWFRAIGTDWDAFWFSPQDPATLSLIRVLTGAMLLYTHAVWGLELTRFFGDNGWLDARAVGNFTANSYHWSYLFYLNTPIELWSAHIVALIIFACLMVGFQSRIAAILSLFITLSYIHRAQGALFGLDQINSMLAMYLCVGPCGARYSVDRWLANRRGDDEVEPSIAANIAVRLIQVHMCIIYAFAGTSKLTGNSWWDGSAMWYALGNYEYQSLDMTWLAHWPRLISLITQVSLFWELTYAVMIWSPRWRWVWLALAVPLHMGIAVCLGMVTFGLVMLFGNLAFVPPETVRWALRLGRVEKE